MKLNIQLFGDGEVVIPVNLDTKGFDREIAKLEYELDELEETYKLALKDPDFDKKSLIDLEAEIQHTGRKLDNLRKKQEALNQTTNDYGKTFKTLGTKLTKMGLAVFGIRSAFMLVRQSMNQIAQDNEVLANKLNTIKGALATAIAPIAEGLVNIVYKLLAYLNVITKTFLGIDLFKKSAKSSKQTYQNAKKLSKTLAGFDEMNVLNDNTSQAGGGGGSIGGLKIEEPDTTSFRKVVRNFQKMWNDILEIDRDEAKNLLLQNGNTWGAFELLVFDFTQGTIKEFQGMFDILSGLWDIMVGWATDDDEKIRKGQTKTTNGLILIWEGFKQKIKGIIEFPYNLGITVGTKIRNFIIDKVITPIKNKFEKFKEKVEPVFNNIKTTAVGALNKIISAINKLIRGLNKIKFNIPDWIPLIGGKTFSFNLKEIEPIKLARGGIINMPGRGVPVGGAIAGEQGREAVLPLQDSQVLSEIADAIGRRITINATIPVYAYNRQVDRQMRRIQAEDSFASNR